jgi:hypothetical protein
LGRLLGAVEDAARFVLDGFRQLMPAVPAMQNRPGHAIATIGSAGNRYQLQGNYIDDFHR